MLYWWREGGGEVGRDVVEMEGNVEDVARVKAGICQKFVYCLGGGGGGGGGFREPKVGRDERHEK